ncbi:hypothetical protein JOC78_000872 [Bacillus ectoiniformans]|uniref:hypothetical protein n=1 Tax=Bacillus ectoiniformans TaxID=1494429 RepID=UPI00195A5A79|nr:hypothetical protein [Bacillus ectoiniformans]MBM7647932.1 hypothetical protein [Bacillus ectoiniformans]
MSSPDKRKQVVDQFHCCATCRHFEPSKTANGMSYFCSRLGYETQPSYKFNCWSPKDQVVQLMKKKLEDQELNDEREE